MRTHRNAKQRNLCAQILGKKKRGGNVNQTRSSTQRCESFPFGRLASAWEKQQSRPLQVCARAYALALVAHMACVQLWCFLLQLPSFSGAQVCAWDQIRCRTEEAVLAWPVVHTSVVIWSCFRFAHVSKIFKRVSLTNILTKYLQLSLSWIKETRMRMSQILAPQGFS